VNSLLKTVTRQRRDCDLNQGPKTYYQLTYILDILWIRGRTEALTPINFSNAYMNAPPTMHHQEKSPEQ